MITLERARAWYPDNDAVHGFGHIARVFSLCTFIGAAEGADIRILCAAALLHDVSGSHPKEGQRNEHHIYSSKFAKLVLGEEGWDKPSIDNVCHCILTHRFREDNLPATIEAKVLFDADKLDVLGAVGIVRTLSYAFQAGQPAFAEPSEHFLKTREILPGEPHSAFHEYLFKLKDISSRLFTNTARQLATKRQDFLDKFFMELKAEYSPIQTQIEKD